MDSSRTRVHLPVLAAELPPGWTVAERATLVTPDGHMVEATLQRADAESDGPSLIEHHLAEVRREYPDAVALTRSSSRWRGDIDAHHCTIRLDEPDRIRAISVVVADGLALTVTGTRPTDGADDTRDIETVIAGIRLLSRPAYEPQIDGEAVESRPPAARSPVAPEVWAQLHSSWSSVATRAPEPDLTTTWSMDELATIATIMGAASFPTVGTTLFAALTDAELHAVLGATMRSLTARGIVDISSNGSASLDDALRTTMEIALLPDLAISVEANSAGSTRGTYFGIRPDRAVRVDVTPNGARSCSPADPAGIVEALTELLGGHHDASQEQRESLHLQEDELSEHWGAMDSSWQISSTWRTDTTVTGHVLYAACDANGQYWIADSDDQSWTIRPITIDELRDEIVGCLPGSS